MDMMVSVCSAMFVSILIRLPLLVQSEDDPLISLVEEGATSAIEAASLALPVNLFPWRRIRFSLRSLCQLTYTLHCSVKYTPSWFPGVNIHKAARKGRALSHKIRFKPYFDTKRKIVSQPCSHLCHV